MDFRTIYIYIAWFNPQVAVAMHHAQRRAHSRTYALRTDFPHFQVHTISKFKIHTMIAPAAAAAL